MAAAPGAGRAPGTSSVFALVRHAHAGSKKRWAGPDADRPLSVRGRQQAAGLAENLRAMPVSALLAGPAVRCVQTLEPMSVRRGLQIARTDLLAPGGNTVALDQLLARPQSEGAVLCTHGEVIKALFDLWRRTHTLLVSADDPDADRISTAKGGTWIVETDGPERTVHYLAPLHVGPPLPADAGAWP